MNAPETPPTDVKREMTNATRKGTRGKTVKPETGKNIETPDRFNIFRQIYFFTLIFPSEKDKIDLTKQ
jgi:hypothetical protein